jgi:carboxymethylenebutenolidase
VIEKQVELPTDDGRMGCFIVHPDRGGPFPVVLFYMDAPGIREELRDMARRLATTGCYVMLPNLYYRSDVEELGTLATDSDLARMRALMRSIDIPEVMRDTDAMLAFAKNDDAASRGPAGTVGYCMSGKYAIAAAARNPDRIKAAASVYGVHLVTKGENEPYLPVDAVTGEVYVAAAENDRFVPLEEMTVLAEDFRAKGVNGEVEVYPGVDHGFAFPNRMAYDKAAAEKHWARLHALFDRNLRGLGDQRGAAMNALNASA